MWVLSGNWAKHANFYENPTSARYNRNFKAPVKGKTNRIKGSLKIVATETNIYDNSDNSDLILEPQFILYARLSYNGTK